MRAVGLGGGGDLCGCRERSQALVNLAELLLEILQGHLHPAHLPHLSLLQTTTHALSAWTDILRHLQAYAAAGEEGWEEDRICMLGCGKNMCAGGMGGGLQCSNIAAVHKHLAPPTLHPTHPRCFVGQPGFYHRPIQYRTVIIIRAGGSPSPPTPHQRFRIFRFPMNWHVN